MLDWLFGAGIGTNLGASLIWGLAAGGLGWWLRGHVRALHDRLDALHESHARLHSKLDGHASAIEALHQRISQDRRDAGARPPRPRGPRA